MADAKSPRYAGYAAWRMVTRRPVETDTSGESWGSGDRFCYASLVYGRVYCFGVTNAPEGADGGSIEELRERFAHWHEPIPSLLAEVGGKDPLYHDIFDLPPLDAFVRGRVALVGDAAHAMTPNLGQGGCQALEDSVVLAECVANDDLAAYDGRRRPRTQMIASGPPGSASSANCSRPSPSYCATQRCEPPPRASSCCPWSPCSRGRRTLPVTANAPGRGLVAAEFESATHFFGCEGTGHDSTAARARRLGARPP